MKTRVQETSGWIALLPASSAFREASWSVNSCFLPRAPQTLVVGLATWHLLSAGWADGHGDYFRHFYGVYMSHSLFVNPGEKKNTSISKN